jgi:hypothetical protein
MGNRRKPKNPRLAMEEGIEVDVPIKEKTVHKQVPATIHWATVEGNDRTDDEVIGTAIIYDDGTSDVIVNSDISPDAKRLVKIINMHSERLDLEA